jgi:hypothetical protein
MCTDMHRTCHVPCHHHHQQQQQQQRNYPEPSPSTSPVDLRFPRPDPTQPNPLFTSLRVQHDPAHANRRTDRVAGTRTSERASERATSASLLPLRDFLRSFPRPGDGMPCTHIPYLVSTWSRFMCCEGHEEAGKRAGCWAGYRSV